MSPRSPHRFYYPGNLDPAEAPLVQLSADESHHALRVLRLKPGTLLDVFDASGRAFSAEMAGTESGLAQIRLLCSLDTAQTGRTALNFAVALLKRRAMDLMLEKLSELGVDNVQPLLTSRCVALSDVKPYTEPPPRWDRLVLAAAKQSGRNRPLTVLPPAPVLDWLKRPAPPAHQVYAHLNNEALPIAEWVREIAQIQLPIWVAIGPEGGWAPKEVEAFDQAGYKAVHMGDLTLRAETAAIAAAAVCRLAGDAQRDFSVLRD